MKLLRKTDYIILVGVLLFCAISLSLYQRWDSMDFSSTGSLEEIGVIQLSKNDIRVKNKTQISWRNGKTSDKLYRFDAVYSGDNSSSELVLKSGISLHTDPKSLIYLDELADSLRLDLSYGSFAVTANSQKPIILVTGQGEYRLMPNQAKFRVGPGKDGKPEIQVLSGSLKVFAPGKETPREVLPNQNYVIDKAHASPWTSVSQLEAPADGAVIQNQGTPTTFRWQSTCEGCTSTVEVFSDAALTQNVAQVTTRENETPVVLPNASGVFFWKVRQVDPTGETFQSQVARFTSVKLDPVQVIAPTPEFIYRDQMRTASDLPSNIQIRWSPGDQFDYYQLQVSSDSSFSRLLLDQASLGGEYQTEALPEGNYYLRIRGVDKDYQMAGPWSATTHFEKRYQYPSLPAPNLLTLNQVFFTSDPPRIQWTLVPEANGYYLEVSADPDFKTIAASATTSDTSWTWKDALPGKFYARVSTLNFGNRRGVFSDMTNLAVNAPETDKTKADLKTILAQTTPAPEAENEDPAKQTQEKSGLHFTLGAGLTYLTMNQNIDTFGSTNFSSLQAPSLLAEFGIDKANWSFTIAYQTVKGQVPSSQSTLVGKKDFSWNTLKVNYSYVIDPDSIAGSVLYLKVNIQDHSIPILSPASASTVALSEYKMQAVGLGLELQKDYGNWTLGADLNYQLPMAFSSRLPEFKLQNQFSFDGHLKAMKRISESMSAGVYWGGQSYQHIFHYYDSVNAQTASGTNNLFFSDLSAQLKWDF